MIREPFDPIPGVSTQIGYYLAALEYTRAQLQEGVSVLSKAQIAAKLMPEASSIGQLLIHSAEAEWWWIHCVIGGRSRGDFEDRELFHVTDDDDYSSRGHTADFCLDHLKTVRDETREALADVPDSDLEKFLAGSITAEKRSK